MVAERDILAAIRLDLGREADLTLWRLGQGMVRDHLTGRTFRLGLAPGAADLIGVLAPHGRWFCLEAKAARGRQSDEQRMWGRLIRDHGGFYAVVRSVTDAREALERARKGECE